MSGPVVDKINQQVLEAARDFRPDLVWAEKQEYLRRETIELALRLPRKLHRRAMKNHHVFRIEFHLSAKGIRRLGMQIEFLLGELIDPIALWLFV
jgi:hypothetical protein